ncbi:RidA family protein [Deinococcus metallilatus]|uniref:Enamine deaminase RidA (YjgF/YER057c/UK114 family) n=1 Tax=Deinococcus metallilatus TaxID=1211322 RepID=A0AAJ5F5C3_9DEIO|nr:RidA family protein [Deinococcus metallilatus]MBB5294843.1 enamine deaminase RidA (YjgF/YER057c/UK114 family) [Deinococcus metallilatus]QBY09440.1 RidA family protein [Deinococcus metallilatus]RXJ09445.1 RidA family protein [Deinococcus metallilatus]TLK28968.1 RidA family protein [Deinococcus metallilatus]GMA16770.1 enamine deaminase RidA [Deinococcus metallilatus]
MSDMPPNVRFVNVPTLGRAPGYSHLAEVRGGRTVYLSGQIAVDESGATVGAGDFTAQARKVFGNIALALAEVGLTFDSVVKLTFFLTDFAHLPQMRAVRDEFVNVQTPPTSSAVQVAALVRPELLIEVEAIAVAP